MKNRKFTFQLFALVVVVATVLTACGPKATPTAAPGTVNVPKDLLKACKTEGTLTIIATRSEERRVGKECRL